jgi:hypothetical protein
MQRVQRRQALGKLDSRRVIGMLADDVRSAPAQLVE